MRQFRYTIHQTLVAEPSLTIGPQFLTGTLVSKQQLHTGVTGGKGRFENGLARLEWWVLWQVANRHAGGENNLAGIRALAGERLDEAESSCLSH